MQQRKEHPKKNVCTCTGCKIKRATGMELAGGIADTIYQMGNQDTSNSTPSKFFKYLSKLRKILFG